MKKISLEKQHQQGTMNSKAKQKLLPQGTCSIQDYAKLQEYRIILSYPLYEYLTFPSQPKYFPCVLLKEIVEGEEPIYHIYYEISKRRLLSAQKQPKNIGCNYIISKKQKPKKDQYFVGKLRGNYRNNQFTVFDGGQNPKKKCVRKRKQFAFIRFNQDSIFNQTLQKMQVLVPQIQETAQSSQSYPKYYPRQFIPIEQKQNLLLQECNNRCPKVIKLNQNINYGLNNHAGKSVNLSSTYRNSLNNNQGRINFALQIKEDQNILHLDSRSKNTYSLSIGYPLNLVQGFAISLAIIERGLK